MQIQVKYNGKLLGHMDKYDSEFIREFWARNGSGQDDWFEMQDKYQTKFGIDDSLDFIDPEYVVTK